MKRRSVRRPSCIPSHSFSPSLHSSFTCLIWIQMAQVPANTNPFLEEAVTVPVVMTTDEFASTCCFSCA